MLLLIKTLGGSVFTEMIWEENKGLGFSLLRIKIVLKQQWPKMQCIFNPPLEQPVLNIITLHAGAKTHLSRFQEDFWNMILGKKKKKSSDSVPSSRAHFLFIFEFVQQTQKGKIVHWFNWLRTYCYRPKVEGLGFSSSPTVTHQVSTVAEDGHLLPEKKASVLLDWSPGIRPNRTQ